MDRYYELKQMTKEFFTLLAEHTEMLVDLFFISHEGLINREASKRLCIGEGLTSKEAFRVLERENAWWKNEHRHENVYFAWSKKNKGFNIAFVDDVQGKYADVFKQKNHLLLTQTSQMKHQGFFKLDRYVSAQELLFIQKALQKAYRGDNGAVGTYQLKRVAGFINTKYGDGFIVKAGYIGENVISADEVLNYIRKQMREQEAREREIRLRKGNEKLKRWRDFYDGDESAADIKYALYLLRKGFYEEQIKATLMSESLDIIQRKGARVDDYLDRTIKKALSYIFVSIDEPLT